MKTTEGSGLPEGFSPALSTGDFEFLKLPGNEAKARLIQELFERGREAEARKVLRETLTELAAPSPRHARNAPHGTPGVPSRQGERSSCGDRAGCTEPDR